MLMYLERHWVSLAARLEHYCSEATLEGDLPSQTTFLRVQSFQIRGKQGLMSILNLNDGSCLGTCDLGIWTLTIEVLGQFSYRGAGKAETCDDDNCCDDFECMHTEPWTRHS